MDTELFDETNLLDLPASPAASPPRRLKRLKKFSQTTTTRTTPPAVSPSTTLNPPSPPPPPSDEETLAPPPPPPPHSTSPPQPPASDADGLDPLPSSTPEPSSSPLPPTDTAEEEDDGLDPLFSETCGGGGAGWDPLGMTMGRDRDGDEEEVLEGGGLIEELRRESAKKRLDMDECGGGEMPVDAEVTGKRSKRRKKEQAPKEAARGKKRAEKERRVQLDSIHAESQRLLRETRKASFKPIAQPVYKPISSVLEKIRLRKLEILKKSNTPIDDEEEDSSEALSGPAGHSCMPRADGMGMDNKDTKIDNGDNEDRNEGGDEDEDALTLKKDLNNCASKSPDKEIFDHSRDNHEENAQSGDNPVNVVDETQLPPSSSPAKSTDDDDDDTSSEDEYNDKENIDPDTQKSDANIQQQLQQALAEDSCPDEAILKDFLDIEAEEEDDSDDDMMRFKDNEEDDENDENEVLNNLIAAGFEEEEVDHEKRNALHQKWLQQQDANETNNVMQRLKFGHQEHKELMDEEDDIEDCEEESENEMSYDLTPTNVVRQNSEKAKQMIARMFTDENDTYEHSDDEEIEEHLARQCISKRVVHNSSFISPLEDDNSREVFGMIKKLNIAPQPKRKGKQAASNLEMLMVGSNSNSSSKSSFLGRTASGSMSSSHRSVYRTYVFGRDDSNSNSRSCLSNSESNSDMDQTTNSSQPKKAKFSSSQPKPALTRTNSEADANSGASLFEILRRSTSSSDKQEHSRQGSFGIITESQAVHQFSAFKLSRKFSRVGARN